METISVQLLEPKAMQLLEQLEELRLLRVVRSSANEGVPLSRRLRGSITREAAEQMQKDIQQSREEWQRDI